MLFYYWRSGLVASLFSFLLSQQSDPFKLVVAFLLSFFRLATWHHEQNVGAALLLLAALSALLCMFVGKRIKVQRQR
jgi:hypothetical protein